MDDALDKISDESLKIAIKQAFKSTGSLDDTLFSKEVRKHWANPNLNLFIKEYVNLKYDFSLYRDIFGEKIFTKLNNIQDEDPSKRPSIENLMGIFNTLTPTNQKLLDTKI